MNHKCNSDTNLIVQSIELPVSVQIVKNFLHYLLTTVLLSKRLGATFLGSGASGENNSLFTNEIPRQMISLQASSQLQLTNT
jgi:hypothetical protein